MSGGLSSYGITQDLAGIEAYLRSLSQPKPPPELTATEKDVGAFKKRLDDAADWVNQLGADFVKRVTGEAYYKLVQATPVDTGRARSGWQIQVNGSAGTQPQTALQSIKLGDRVGLANPIPYMESLNRGHSKQAPAGFVDRILADVQAKFARVS